MLKLGFRYDEVLAMSEVEMDGYLEAFEEIRSGEDVTRKYLVMR